VSSVDTTPSRLFPSLSLYPVILLDIIVCSFASSFLAADCDPTLPSARGALASDSGHRRPLLPSPPRHRDRLISRNPQVTLPSLETLRSARNAHCRCVATQDLDAGDDFPASRNPNHLLPLDMNRRDPNISLTRTVTLDPARRFLIRSNDPEGRSNRNGIDESGSAAWQPEDYPTLFFVLKFQKHV
jgi:hypothetical protein